MTFRTKLILAFAPIALVPVAVLALIVRSVMNERFVTQFNDRVAAEVDRLESDLRISSQDLDNRIRAIGSAAADDNRFRLAATGVADRGYLLDYAERAMRLAGLDVLQIQGPNGRILSSGHFRNEFDQVMPVVTGQVRGLGEQGVVRIVDMPTGEQTTIVRADSFRVGANWFHVMGGFKADRFVGSERSVGNVSVSLRLGNSPTSDASQAESIVRELLIPFISGATVEPTGGVISIAHSVDSLRLLQDQLDRWFLIVFGIAGVFAVGLATLLAAQLSKPLAALADRTEKLDLDNLDVQFQTDRRDEIGALTRLLSAMVTRIRSSTTRLREAERRAAVGDIARQVNHDIKNGLVPIRNVFAHLTQVQDESPADLNKVFDERRQTVTSSISYLENLATQYAKLTPSSSASACDVGAIVEDAVRGLDVPQGCRVQVQIGDDLPLVRADRLSIRRIVENLMGNAIDSLGDEGVVTLLCSHTNGSGTVRLSVVDNGRGMKQSELDRVFEDFYTTKEAGTGLGLSVVRRLLGDMGGSVRVQTEFGVGTTVIVDFPTHGTEQNA